MIYKISYFKKELRQAYEENKTSTNRTISFALSLGLISFAVYFVFQTLEQSVVADTVPEIMQASYFSTLYIYIHLTLFLFTAYYIYYYDYLFFAEIRRNSWYLLIKMGYSPERMFFSKLIARLYSVVIAYTVGFGFTILLTYFLKFNFIITYLPTLYLTGLFDLILITVLAMTFSLYTKTVVNARYWIFSSMLFIIVMKLVLKQYDVISNRVMMQDFFSLFDFNQTFYLPVGAGILLLCLIICRFQAHRLARYYNIVNDEKIVPFGLSVVFLNEGGKIKLSRAKGIGVRQKLFDTAVTVFLAAFIGVSIVFNVFIIFINASTPGQIVNIKGTIPFIFRSVTMEPAIMMNDLTYFQKIDGQYPVGTDDVVLFTEENIIYVERVKEKQGDELTVDIDSYPPNTQIGSMEKIIARENVYGIYSGRNRWLGALILFANTIVGRLVLLLVPAVILFYHGELYKLFKREEK